MIEVKHTKTFKNTGGRKQKFEQLNDFFLKLEQWPQYNVSKTFLIVVASTNLCHFFDHIILVFN